MPPARFLEPPMGVEARVLSPPVEYRPHGALEGYVVAISVPTAQGDHEVGFTLTDVFYSDPTHLRSSIPTTTDPLPDVHEVDEPSEGSAS
eukprot:3971233-Lingulodinium_polyedra.AAC.1